MKRIFNDSYEPYFTLPNGVTITLKGSSNVLNEAILDSPIVKDACANGQIRVVDLSEQTKSGPA
jgi:hypothetical protein